jgi:hypothetical protein
VKYFELLEVDALAVSLGRVVVVVVVVCVEVAPGGGAGGVVPGVVDCASTGNANRAEAATMLAIEVDLAMIKCLPCYGPKNEQAAGRFRSVRAQKNV